MTLGGIDWLRRGGESDREISVLSRIRARLLGWDAPREQQWCRIVMNDSIAGVVSSLGPEHLAAAEISGDFHRGRGWSSYTSLTFPDFDVCSSTTERLYDVVICEQVLEHVRDPVRAVRTLFRSVVPGGHVVVSTPFLIRVHKEPEDLWRFTSLGLRVLLEAAGFEVLAAEGWGNRACAIANFRHWVAHRPWRSLRNDESFPVVTWALARRPLDDPVACA